MFQHVRRIVDRDALHLRASGLQGPRQEDLAVEIGSHADYVREPAELGIQLPPVGDAFLRIFGQNHHVSRGAEQTDAAACREIRY